MADDKLTPIQRFVLVAMKEMSPKNKHAGLKPAHITQQVVDMNPDKTKPTSRHVTNQLQNQLTVKGYVSVLPGVHPPEYTLTVSPRRALRNSRCAYAPRAQETGAAQAALLCAAAAPTAQAPGNTEVRTCHVRVCAP